jgi:C4-dicarboxylate-specific signal transduction histidine kinase
MLRIRSEIWDTMLFRPQDRAVALTNLDRQASAFYDARRSLSALEDSAVRPAVFQMDVDFRLFFLFAKDVLALPDLGAFTAAHEYPDKFKANQAALESRLDQVARLVDREFQDSLAETAAAQNRAGAISMILPGLAIAFALAASLVMPRRLTASLRQLSDVALVAAGGDSRIRADLGPAERLDREVATLVASFNHLLDENHAYRDRMGELVAERTRALEENNLELQATLDTLKDTQEYLIQSEKMAALGPLVAGIAHEVNTPIGNSITASSFLASRLTALKEQFDLGELRRSDLAGFLETGCELTRIMGVNLQKAGELISSFKRVAVDQQSNERRQFELGKYVDEIITAHQPLFKSTPHRILNRVEMHLAADTHPGALYQILSNLITNSLRHAFRDGRAGTITIAGHARDGDAVIDYTDDGTGIPEVHRKHIFDPFYTTMRNSGGSGLGLYISFNQAIGNLAGFLSLVEESPGGVHFRLRFPLVLPSGCAGG